MGSSAKKKREKKKDFQKPKLKVGKARPKAANQTDTSFRSKAIVLNQQSLHVSAPSTSNQFLHNLSLLSSRSDSQRRDSLAHLASCLSSWPDGSALPQPSSTILHKVYPLLLDGSKGVRQQAWKVLQSLGRNGMTDHVSEALPYVRAGMTHLAPDIRFFSIEVLAWLMELAPQEIVSCAGGWTKTLNCFLALLGWHKQDPAARWSSLRVTFGKAGGDAKAQARHLQVLAEFLKAGFDFAGTRWSDSSENNEQEQSLVSSFPLWHAEHHALPKRSNPYGYLNLFASQGNNNDDDDDDAYDTAMLEDPEDRIRVFKDRYLAAVQHGLSSSRKDGGEVGRAAGLLAKALQSLSREAGKD